MSQKKYHNIDGSSSLYAELLPAGSGFGDIKSISISNTSNTNNTLIALNLYNDSRQETFQLLSKVTIPTGVTMIIDDQGLLSFDNSRKGFGLFAEVDSNTTCDVLINTL